MKKIIEELNKKEIFHVVSAKGDKVEVLSEAATLRPEDKKFLQEFYGYKDFSIPSQDKDPFLNKAAGLGEK